MSKSLSLLFSLAAVALFVCTGAALSYREAGLALLFFLASFVMIGLGFYVKRRSSK
ncbi:DUF5325 family protein [Xylanibacillus composti]|uniref:DUF5325 family protein n=1 Tax=Xylanibacillus composti TaxID=1572762 RepID=A0A8J4H064_9BACL|nr:hypothetical protein XYCOK13_12530 [Xylanibacillus composti]